MKEIDIKIKYLSRQVRIHALNNASIPFTKCVKLTFKINNIFVTGSFYVTNYEYQKSYNMLIGYDFLKINKIILDCNRNVLQLKNTQIPLDINEPNTDEQNIINYMKNSKIQCTNKKIKHDRVAQRNSPKMQINNEVPAKIIKKLTFQPGETKLVQLKITRNLDINKFVLFEPVKNKIN